VSSQSERPNWIRPIECEVFEWASLLLNGEVSLTLSLNSTESQGRSSAYLRQGSDLGSGVNGMAESRHAALIRHRALVWWLGGACNQSIVQSPSSSGYGWPFWLVPARPAAVPWELAFFSGICLSLVPPPSRYRPRHAPRARIVIVWLAWDVDIGFLWVLRWHCNNYCECPAVDGVDGADGADGGAIACVPLMW
jgi:hypothetical protein